MAIAGFDSSAIFLGIMSVANILLAIMAGIFLIAIMTAGVGPVQILKPFHTSWLTACDNP